MGHELSEQYRNNLDSSVLAYERARARREAAQQVEEDALRTVLFDAGNCGLSVREIAALVRLPKTTIGRQRIASALDVGADSWHSHDPDEYVAANNAAWAHEPSRLISEAPFTVEALEDGRLIVSMRPRRPVRPSE